MLRLLVVLVLLSTAVVFACRYVPLTQPAPRGAALETRVR